MYRKLNSLIVSLGPRHSQCPLFRQIGYRQANELPPNSGNMINRPLNPAARSSWGKGSSPSFFDEYTKSATIKRGISKISKLHNYFSSVLLVGI